MPRPALIAIALQLLYLTQPVPDPRNASSATAQQEAENHAFVALQRHDPVAAEPHLRRWLAISQGREDASGAQTARHELAVALLCQGRFDEAEREMALARRSREHLPRPSDPVPTFAGGFNNQLIHGATIHFLTANKPLASPAEIAAALEDFERIGEHYRANRLPEDAIGYYREALRLAPRARWIEQLAVATMERGDPACAITLAQRATVAYQKERDAVGAARTTCQKAHACILTGKLDRAQALLDTADRALHALPNKQRWSADPPVRIALWKGRGDLARRRGDAHDALRWHVRAYLAQYTRGPKRAVGERAMEIAHDYRALGKSDQALHWLDIAADEFHPAEAMPQWIEARLLAGRCHESRGDLPAARRACEDAVRAFERMHFRLPRAIQTARLDERLSAGLYASLARILLRLRRPPEEALAILERGRGQALRRQFAFSERFLYRRASPENRRLWSALRQRLETARHSGSAQEVDAATLRLHFFQDHRWANDLPSWIAAQALEWGLDQASPERRRRGIRRDPIEPGTLELTFATVDDRETILLSRDSRALRAFLLPVGRRRLEEMAAAWRTALETHDSILAARSEQVMAHQLYAVLLSPIEEAGMLRPGRVRRLRIIADGPLGAIPFGALVDAGQRRLIERFTLTHPFPRLLSVPPAAPSTLPVLSVAAPKNALSPLRSAPAEADTIAALFPGALHLSANRATRKRVTEAMPRAAVLHFATHAISDLQDGLRSSLFLARNASSDGRLEAGDLLAMSLSARLAILSACETARGQAAGGDSVIGLPWALRAAGCRQTAASLWGVDDAVTGKIIVRFLKRVRRGERCDDALRQAILAVRQSPLTRRPFFWAAFQLYGEGGRIGQDAPPLPAAPRDPPVIAAIPDQSLLAPRHRVAIRPHPERIAFLSDRLPGGARDGVTRVYTMTPEGRDLQALTGPEHQNLWSPDLSRDGSKVVFVSTMRGNPDLYILDLATRALQQITDPLVDHAANVGPASLPKDRLRLAPDDGTILFEVLDRIFIADTAGSLTALREAGKHRTLQAVSQASGPGAAPTWSPDGRGFAFVRREDGNGEIYLAASPISARRHPFALTRLTVTAQDESDPDFSPDGTRLVFARAMGAGNTDLFVRDLATGEETRLTHHTGRDAQPRFSPDGRRVVFVSDRTGVAQLWIVDAAMGDETGLRSTGIPGTSPSWR